MAGLQNGHSHIRHIKLEGIQNSVKERLSVTSDVSKNWLTQLLYVYQHRLTSIENLIFPIF